MRALDWLKYYEIKLKYHCKNYKPEGIELIREILTVVKNISEEPLEDAIDDVVAYFKTLYRGKI